MSQARRANNLGIQVTGGWGITEKAVKSLGIGSHHYCGRGAVDVRGERGSDYRRKSIPGE